uniref:ARAD1A13838p n=1 Tax=Blastobotrys adeninivorans TaxID=409370 RepID=A0A060T427_BLAAD
MLSKMLARNGSNIVRPGKEGEEERIKALEAQIKELAETAARAVDRAEVLEEELKRSKQSNTHPNNNYSSGQYKKCGMSSSSSENSLFSVMNDNDSAITDISMSPPASPRDNSKLVQLEKQLATERQRRMDAEAREQSLSAQIEELSASLFEDANKRVSDQNKKVSELEAIVQSYESKDPNKLRIHRLEVAIKAIHNARRVLNSPTCMGYI